MPATGDWNAQISQDDARRLRNDLYNANSTIIALMPREIADLLRGFHNCASREEADQWRFDVSDAVIKLADVQPVPERPFATPRAMCPLCRQGSPYPGVEGYAVPDGLRRHLEGTHGTSRCAVMEAVFALAYDYWFARFGAAERAAEAAKMEKLAERRESEALYRVSPRDAPKLLEEDSYSSQPRSADQLAWAENRLESLGFKRVIEGRTLSWVDEQADYVVYADHRFVGRLSFEVWRKPLPKKPRVAGRRLSRSPGGFVLLDSLKHDLRGKYAERVAQALKRKC